MLIIPELKGLDDIVSTVIKREVPQLIEKALENNTKILVEALKKEILDIHEELAKHDKRFDSIDSQFKQLRDQIKETKENHNARLTALEYRP